LKIFNKNEINGAYDLPTNITTVNNIYQYNTCNYNDLWLYRAV